MITDIEKVMSNNALGCKFLQKMSRTNSRGIFTVIGVY